MLEHFISLSKMMGFLLSLLLLSVANLKQFWGKFWVYFIVGLAPPFLPRQVRTVPLERRAREELALRSAIPFSLLDTVSDSGGDRKDRGRGLLMALLPITDLSLGGSGSRC